jgi:hypothetical protein
MNEIASRSPGDIIESVIAKGDLAKLTPQERTDYYTAVCRSVGLNPLTQPLAYIALNGKLTLYALRGATDQLRNIHKVSVEDMTETERDGVYIVTCKVKNAEGRTDMAKGAVSLGNLKGEALANAFMRAETKAKRRATLSICGLSLLDETEVETIPDARKVPNPAPVEIAAPAPLEHDPVTGEIGPRTFAVPLSGDKKNWILYGQAIIAALKASTTRAELEEWIRMNGDHLNEMAQSAPRASKSVSEALAKAHADLAAIPPDTRLPAKESQQLRRALVKRLAECQTLAQVEAWRAASAESIASLQDEDRAGVTEWEATRREQLTEVAEVVG